MAQQTMSEKDQYLATADREAQTTLKVLRAFPPAKQDLKASDTSASVREIAWTLVRGRMVVDSIIKGDLTPSGGGPVAPPATLQEIITAFEQANRDAVAKVSKLKDEDFNDTIRMPTGPKQMGEVRKGNALWMFLSDQIHHRGQLSVYLRMAGGKVPSIYGPSGDEPWF